MRLDDFETLIFFSTITTESGHNFPQIFHFIYTSNFIHVTPNQNQIHQSLPGKYILQIMPDMCYSCLTM